MGKPNVLFLKYEDLICNFETWLERVIHFLDFNLSEEMRLRMIKEAQDNMKLREENIYKHRRHVLPGDYKEKLKKETIEGLNKKYGPVMSRFGYS